MKNLLAIVLFIVGTGMSFGQSKVGHVNSQKLLEGMESRKQALTKIKEFEDKGYDELYAMQTDFEKAFTDFSEKSPDLSPILKKIEEEKLMKKQQAVEERQQSLQKEMQAYAQELNAPILEMLKGAIKTVAETKKFNYIIDASQVMYSNGEDITDAVKAELDKLDKEYLANQK